MRGIADYRFVDKLGEGNHGTFWLAVAPTRLQLDAEHVAVKTLDQRATESDFKRMANELRLYSSVRSPFLVELYDAGHQEGTLYYAATYYPDGSLTTRPAPDVVRRACADAARAAHALHEVGVAHRDIKPSNVMLENGGGRLGDLGLAQVLNPGQTVTGIGPLGALEYLAPEIVRGEPATRATDAWAIGATFHHALTGQSAFPDLPTGSLLDALRHLLRTPPALDGGLGLADRAVVERCMAATPEERPATCLELAEMIEETTT